jgi:hypothetical protein
MSEMDLTVAGRSECGAGAAEDVRGHVNGRGRCAGACEWQRKMCGG